MKERNKTMNEAESLTLQKAMEDISRMLEHKDCLIHEQKATIEYLKDESKHSYNHGVNDGFAKGLDEGMKKAWNLADRIIHLDWVGDENIHTVEDWFELFTAKDALKVMDDLIKKEKPYWKMDATRNVFECSKCGYTSYFSTKFCPECGRKMCKHESWID